MDLQLNNNLLPDASSHNNYPTLLRRIQSIFIDSIIILTTMVCLTVFISYFEATPDWIKGTLFFALVGIYEPILIASGGTIGNRVMKIQVMQYNDGKKTVNIFQSYIRFIVKLFFGWLSFITIHMNVQKRALHDLASGSVMIQNP